MSDRGPGTRAYLIDTVMVAVAGLVLAIWLWDGWPFVFVWAEDPIYIGTPDFDLGDYFDAGCITAENLRAMAEGRATTVRCDGLYTIEPTPERTSP